jgi:hypothetical protein
MRIGVKRQLAVVIAHKDIVEVCYGVKRLLTVVAVGSDIVEVLLKMPHIFRNVEYAGMLYVYGFCEGSATAAVDEYRRRNVLKTLETFYDPELSAQETDSNSSDSGALRWEGRKILCAKYRKPFGTGHTFV